MQENLNFVYQAIGIVVGIGTFYGVVTKPIKDSIDSLNSEIKQMNKENSETREDVVRIEESVKSAHKRIDKLEVK